MCGPMFLIIGEEFDTARQIANAVCLAPALFYSNNKMNRMYSKSIGHSLHCQISGTQQVLNSSTSINLWCGLKQQKVMLVCW